MSNLGLYETIVRAAHDVGGVEELVAMIARKGFEKGMKAGVASQRPVIAGVGLASLAVGGIIGYLLSDPFTLKADDIMAGDEDMEHINREFVKIINSEDDIEHVRPAMEKLDLDEPGDPSLDELKTRLAAFEGVVSCDSEFEEPVQQELILKMNFSPSCLKLIYVRRTNLLSR